MCSQSFLLENFTMARSLFLPSRWQASILSQEIFTPIWCRIMKTVGSSWSCSTEESMPKTSAHSWREYSAVFQHWRSDELSCLTKASFTFFISTISDASFLKLRLNFFCQSVYCVICLLLILQENFNDLCLIQRLQYFLSINSSHHVEENVAGLKEY